MGKDLKDVQESYRRILHNEYLGCFYFSLRLSFDDFVECMDATDQCDFTGIFCN